MTDKNGYVLNFTRDAAFINQRGRAHRDSGNDMEALRLFRRASEQEPDNLKYRLDVCETLSDMHSTRAAYDGIVDIINDGLIDNAALADSNVAHAVYCTLVRCLNANEYFAGANSILRYARSYIGDDNEADDDDSYMPMVVQTTIGEMSQRNSHIKLHFLERLHMYAEGGNIKCAYALAKRYLRHHKNSPTAHAAMAWAEMLNGNQPDSMEHLVRALAMTKRDEWVLSIAARILLSGEHGQAQPALENAFQVSNSRMCDKVLLQQAIALNMDSLVLDIATKLLEQDAGEPYLCACQAAAMINMGDSPRAALAVMRRSLELYPGDITARHYADIISKSMPDCVPIKYPDHEMLEEWARAVFDIRAMLIESNGIVPMYTDNMIALLEWGLYNRDDDISASSAALLTHAASEDKARMALWHFLASNGPTDDHRLSAMEIMVASDIKLPRIVFLHGKLHSLDENSMCRIMAHEESRLDIRTAAKRLREYPDSIVALRALSFFSGNAQNDANMSATALECAYRITHGEAIRLREVASKRGLNCAKLTRAVYSLIEISHPQED